MLTKGLQKKTDQTISGQKTSLQKSSSSTPQLPKEQFTRTYGLDGNDVSSKKHVGDNPPPQKKKKNQQERLQKECLQVLESTFGMNP